jgi:hypothetical protein
MAWALACPLADVPCGFWSFALEGVAVAAVDLSETGDADLRSLFFPADHGDDAQPLRIIPASKGPMINGNLLMTACRMTNKNEEPGKRYVSAISHKSGGMVLKRLVLCKTEF